MTKQTLITTVLGLTLSNAAFGAYSTVCKNGKMERSVEVTSADSTKSTPCEVKYTKEDQTSKVLWNAQNDAAYCETKAKEFADQLASKGWQCTGATAEATTSAPAATTTTTTTTETTTKK